MQFQVVWSESTKESTYINAVKLHFIQLYGVNEVSNVTGFQEKNQRFFGIQSLLVKSVDFEMSFGCLQFLPKNKQKKST